MLLSWATSLRGKLLLALTGLGILSLSATALGSLWMLEKSISTIEEQTRHSLSIANHLVAINAEAALLFGDKEVAERLLLSLAKEPIVVAGVIQDASGEEMARFIRDNKYLVIMENLAQDSLSTDSRILHSRRNIYKHQEYIGTVTTVADISSIVDQLFLRLTTTFIILISLLTALLFLLLVFLNRFNKRFSKLSQLTQTIQDQRNFDKRVTISGNDELADYSSRFNAMLDVIQLQTSELEVFNLQLAQQTLHDSMTGLPNRLYFKIKIKQLISNYQESQVSFSLVSYDIDHFKRINDQFGHQTGDEVICLFANELKSLANEKVFFSRIGGDEFIGLYQGDHNGSGMKKIYRTVSEGFRMKMTNRLGQGNYSCSAGIACLPDDGMNIRDLLKAADVALYQAKSLGRDTAVTLCNETPGGFPALAPALDSYTRTFDKSRVKPIFQPIYDQQQTMVGIECLATYQEHKDKYIRAFSFIPWLEEEGLISLLDFEMFEKSLREGVRIRDNRQDDLLLFHNFSLDTIVLPNFLEQIEALMKQYGFSPEHLVLEVTETIQLNSIAIHHLKAINKMGCILCIDDFGAGFTNPGYFRQLPWGMVKIDRAYIRNINDPMSRRLVDALFKIARLMDIKVVAEGVERKEDLEFLQKNECDFYQGFYFTPPTEAKNLMQQEQLLSESALDYFNS